MSIYSTTFYKVPYNSTEQERNDYDLLFCERLGIKDDEGNPFNPLTDTHSVVIPHPTDLPNNGYIYAIDESFKKHMEIITGKTYEDITNSEKLDFLPSTNFTNTTDDLEYSVADLKALGWFPDIEI